MRIGQIESCLLLAIFFSFRVSAQTGTYPLPFTFFGANCRNSDYPLKTLCGYNGFVCKTIDGGIPTAVGTIGHSFTFEWPFVEPWNAGTNDDTNHVALWRAHTLLKAGGAPR